MSDVPRPRMTTGSESRSGLPSSRSLALRQACHRLRNCQLSSCVPCCASLPRTAWAKRQVHVVAAEQDVLAYGHALQVQIAVLLRHLDQTEVGGAAAHVADQDRLADLHLLTPVALVGRQPGVERGLRLFQQRESVQPRHLRRLHGQFAGNGVEGGRHGQVDGLPLQPGRWVVLRHLIVPGVTQMCKETRDRFHRREPARVVGRIPGQDGLRAVHAAVGEPRLGRRNETGRQFGAAFAGIFAGRVVYLRLPGQGERVGRCHRAARAVAGRRAATAAPAPRRG